jgi:hypothetical protein
VRVGKFYITKEALEGEYAYKVFSLLEFVPYRVEFLGYNGLVEYIGTSPMFFNAIEGEAPAEYNIIIIRDDTDPIKPLFSIEVDVKKVGNK